jgi:hypothetical protein
MAKLSEWLDLPKRLDIPKWFDLVEWVDLLQGPKDPPFARNTLFAGESKRFWRVLFTSGLLAGISVLLEGGHAAKSFVLSPTARLCITGIAAFAGLYCLGVSRLFGLRITIGQAFFTFGFLVIPWLPIFSFIAFLGSNFGKLSLTFLLMCYLFPIYIVWSVAKGISVVSGASKLRAFLSLSALLGIMAGFGIYSLLTT